MNSIINIDNIDSIIRIKSIALTKDIFMPFNLDNRVVGTGTGFFINKEYILTCYHVVSNSIDISINIQSLGKKKFKVELISFCADCDIALLKLNDILPENLDLNILNLGDSTKIKKGDSVIALGFPLSVNSLKITKGTISGQKGIFFQTDTTINPGNSGGPLIKIENNNLEIIGINTQKIVNSNVDNTGFSLPIKIAIDIWFKNNQINTNMFTIVPNFIPKPELYIRYYNNTPEYLKLKNIKESINGIIIKFILEKSPFYKVGVRVGDIIYKINDFEIDNYGYINSDFSFDKISLEIYILNLNINDTIKIEYISLKDKNKPIKIIKDNIKLENYELEIKEKFSVLHKSNKEYSDFKYEILGGIIISELTLNHLNEINHINSISNQNYYNLLKYKKKKNRLKPVLFISSILDGSYADKLEILEDGDVITKINNIKINTIDELTENIISNNKLIELTTHDNKNMVLDINKIIENESKISELYMYKSTNIFKIIEQYNNGKNKVVNLIKKNINEKNNSKNKEFKVLQDNKENQLIHTNNYNTYNTNLGLLLLFYFLYNK